MIEVIKESVTEYQNRVLSTLLDGLADIYRFSGKYHQVSRPNSVKDHVYSLIDVIGEIFNDLPITYSYVRKDMIMRAIMHDMGELLGEFDVLENVMDGSNISPDTKKEYETVVFSFFLYQAAQSIQANSNGVAYKDMLNTMRRIMSESGDVHSFIANLKKRVDTYSWKEKDMKMLLYYTSIEHDTSYAGCIFKAIDLIDGNEYYVKYPANPTDIPKKQILGFKKYCDEVILRIIESDKQNQEDYSDLTKAVIERLNKTVNNYMELVT